MKKAVSILLVLTIISSCFVFVGCSAEEKLGYFKERRIKQDYIEYFNIQDMSADDVVLDYYGGNYNGCEIVMLDAECHDPEFWIEKFDEHRVYYYDSNRLLVYRFGKFYTLTEAKEKHILFSYQIERIAYYFNDQVKHFRNTCDVHDFTAFWIWDNIDIGENLQPRADMIAVQIDRRLVNLQSPTKTYFDIVDYLGNDIILKEAKVISQETDWVCYSLYICNEGYENIPYVFDRISQIPGVLSAGYYYDHYYPYDSLGNDCYSENPGMWGLESIEVEKVWDFTTGSLCSCVGIIDSGVSLHPDLIDNLMDGYNYANDSEIIDGDVEHGTMVAGVLGARGNNSIGIRGVNWKVGIIPLKIYPTNSTHTTRSDLAELAAQAIRDVTASHIPIKVLNISLEDLTDNLSLKEAVINYHGLIVCSAGNTNSNVDDYPEYPDYYGSSQLLECELMNIIVVGGLDKNGDRYYYSQSDGSNYGEHTVDIYAPGCEILTTRPEEYCQEGMSYALGYDIRTGTSYAAPFVSGVAALLLSIEPDITTEQLKSCIIGGADDITIMVGDNNDIPQDVKKLNAWGAFMYLMDNYYDFEFDEIHYVETSYIQFNDMIQSTSDYSTFKTNTSFIQLNIQTAGHYIFTATAGNDIRMVLLDSSYELITERSTYTTGEASVDFMYYLVPGTYYLKTNFLEEITSDGEIEYGIDYAQEDHQASQYLLYNSTHHRCICACGEFINMSPHTVKLSEVKLGIGHCIYCGARLMLDNTVIQVPGTNNLITVPRSANGSYVLPNGIIVLVDEDVEAYFAGTLHFYEGENVPVTE